MSEIKVNLPNAIRVNTRDIRTVLDIKKLDGEAKTVDLDDTDVAAIDQACSVLEWLAECLDGLPPVGNSDLQAIAELMKERAA